MSSPATPANDFASGTRAGEAPAGPLGFPAVAWWRAGLLAVCYVGLFHQSLLRLWLKTNPINGSAEWAHAVFVPIIGLYYLYLNLDALRAAPVRPLLGLDLYRGRFVAAGAFVAAGLIAWKLLPRLGGAFANYSPELAALGVGALLFGALGLILDWGVGTLLGGLFCYAYGIWPGKNDFLRDFGMVITIFSLVLTLCGWGVMRVAWFPCLFLLCMIPWPGLVYSKLAMPLQDWSARVGVAVMQLFDVSVEKIGTTMLVHRPGGRGDRALDVEEACSGLKSLMTFVSLGAAVAFLSDRPLWQRLLITLSAVPIAILCNALRVGGQGLLDYYVDEAWSAGFAHQFAGLVMLLPGFAMLAGLVWFLDKLFVDTDETEAAAAPSAAAPFGGAA